MTNNGYSAAKSTTLATLPVTAQAVISSNNVDPCPQLLLPFPQQVSVPSTKKLSAAAPDCAPGLP
jgi:hypothetical protein